MRSSVPRPCIPPPTYSFSTRRSRIWAHPSSVLGSLSFDCIDVYHNYVFTAHGCKFDGFLLQGMTFIAVFRLSAGSYDRVYDMCAIILNFFGKLSLKSIVIELFQLDRSIQSTLFHDKVFII
jgi:hypothetical protein